MKTPLKKIIFSLLFLLTLTLAQQAQAQETKEYVTVSIVDAYTTGFKQYVVAYPDGKTEIGELKALNEKNLESNTVTLNNIFNMLAKKGYKMISSNGGGDLGILYGVYIFEK